MPGIAAAICVALFVNTTPRLLHPPDVGSEGKEVVDLEQEAQEAVGLVIQRDQFPDRLFAPPKRDDSDGGRCESRLRQGDPQRDLQPGHADAAAGDPGQHVPGDSVMAVCLFMLPHMAPWYIGYVVLFNMLVGPVFSAGSVTSERERQTLDLLLTTTITPWQILWGKLIAGLRVSSVLTLFLVWPVLLACLMVTTTGPTCCPSLAYLRDHSADLRDDGHAGPVLLGPVSQDVDQSDDDLSGTDSRVLRAAGRQLFRQDLLPGLAGQ